MFPVVVVHGGAWAIPDTLAELSIQGVQRAAKIAWSVVNSGRSAVDAVEAAVTDLEDNPCFDAGTGSVLTIAGSIELDAAIMEGKALKAGSVACVERIKNPIQLARNVMDKTDHVMLVGKGANIFAEECGISEVPLEQLVTPHATESWKMFKKYRCSIEAHFSDRDKLTMDNQDLPNVHLGHDTVGCVVIDKSGLLAAGTSTGGITAKRVGRVGDSPLVGCGVYADNEAAAISCTGHGESITKTCLAFRVAEACRLGNHPNKAVRECLKFMSQRVNGAGGVICVDNIGNIGMGFTTERMAWASIDNDESVYGLNPFERISFEI